MTDVVKALHSSVDHLHGIVVGLDAAQLRRQAYPSEWTVADVLSHLGSGAVISLRGLDDGLSGSAPDPDFNQSVWDEWNAKDPEAQAAGVLAADAALVARLDAVGDAERAAFRFTMGPFDLGFDGFVGLRLNEHVLHTWDVEVALHPGAVLPAVEASAVVDNLEMIARFAGKPTGAEHTVAVATTEPVRGFTLDFAADSLGMSASEPSARPDLSLPAESFVRLVYGRLDPGHTPAGLEGPVLDDLRKAFAGF
jgi:uncharacterized protein (TIGR03083 family)